MSDYQKTCDEIIAAAAKATARPWGNPVCGYRPDGANGEGLLKCVEGQWAEFCREPDAEYVILAANNADRLARLIKALLSEDPLLVEMLADLEHDRWSGWERHRESVVCEERETHWRRLRETPYADLQEHSKESDRNEVRKTLAVVRVWAARLWEESK